jgi:aminopeptidase N
MQFHRALLGLVCFTTVAAHAEFFGLYCAQARWAAAAPATVESSDYLKYAPDRRVDIVNLLIDITPNFDEESITATATFTFKPLAKPLRSWKLDAEALSIDSVNSSSTVASFQNDDHALTINFADDLPVDREQTVTIAYHATPKSGMYFRTAKRGYKAGDTHLFTQGEDMDARYWFPTHDYPNEKFTSEIKCHVPAGMVAFANGRKVSEEKDSNGLTVFDWKQEKPHTSYLVCLVAGYFKGVEGMHRDIPLAFYTVPSESENAASSFAPTQEAMSFFEEEIGVPYPWAKYYQVCVTDFMFGGMENTSLTTLTESTLFSKETENLHNSEGLVAHELAHQWFGDLVTCKDWSHAWLNEGFATFYAHLFDGHKNGRDSMLYEFYQTAQGITRADANSDTRGIVTRRYDAPMEVFSNGIYPKGAWVLRMLRAQLGEDLYRKVIKTYLERNKFQNVDTHDLSSVVEELSGQSWDQFFDQWVYHPHFPELNASYSWDETTKLAKLTLRQTQSVSNQIHIFNFPLTVRFKIAGKNVDREIRVKDRAEDFYFKLDASPTGVRLDPDFVVLAKTSFNPPRSMLLAQLADKDDVIGRLHALQALRSDSSDENVKRLRDLVNNDPFFGVRQEAASVLREIHNPAALEALLASAKQSDARVRIRVADAIASFYDDKAFAASVSALGSEKNPDILDDYMQTLAISPDKEATQRLVKFLDVNSFHQLIANRAISTLRSRRDSAAIGPLMDALKKRWDDFSTGELANGFDALAQLARDDEKQRPIVRDYLTGHLQDKRERLQIAAIRALGTLRDEQSIPALQTFATAGRETPTRNPAESAINAIRAGRPQGNESQAIRGEVMDLKKENRELREEFKTLNEKFQALNKDVKPGTTNKANAKKAKK